MKNLTQIHVNKQCEAFFPIWIHFEQVTFVNSAILLGPNQKGL